MKHILKIVLIFKLACVDGVWAMDVNNSEVICLSEFSRYISVINQPCPHVWEPSTHSFLKDFFKKRLTLKTVSKNHRKHMEWTPNRFLNWATSIGPKAFYLTKHIIETKVHPEQAYRVCLGLLNLYKKYGKERLEAACHRAVHYHTLTRRSVSEILKGGLDKHPLVEIPTESKQKDYHKNIRGPEYFMSIKSKENVKC